MRVYGVMEIPHAENNSRNSVRRLTCSNLKCYTTLIRRETLVPQKEVSHQKLSQASPLMSYICPVLSLLHDHCSCFQMLRIPRLLQKKRSSFANGRKKKLVEVQGCSQKRNAIREYKCLQTTEQLILFILPRNEELPQKIQIKHTDTLN